MPLPPNKVVVVPGFGGTQLSYRGGFGGKTTYWYNPTQMLRCNPLAGALSADGKSPYPVLGKDLFPDGPVGMGVYEPLLTSLSNAGFNPLFWGYDWRLDQRSLSAAFASFLKSSNLSNPFHVIAHSNGGLIAQLAYGPYVALGATNVWRQTIYLGTPHGGSYWAAAALAGWFPGGSELAQIPRVFNLLSPVLADLKSKVFSAFQIALGQLIGSWPGLYGLLPNPLGPWAQDDTDAGLLLHLSEYADTWGGQQQQWFNAAQLMQAAIVTGLTAPRPAEVCLVGTGVLTLGEYDATGEPGYVTSYESTTEGDGTVTAHRATLPGSSVTQTLEGIGHNQLVTGITANALIITALGSQPVGNDVVPYEAPSTLQGPALPPAALTPPILYPFNNLTSDP